MEQPKKILFFSPIYEGTQKDKQTFGPLFKNLFFVALGFCGFVVCLTLFYLAMRGVMDLGGFVASGGPYEIAHQAPSWIWVFFVGAFGGVIFLFLYTIFARKIGGLKITIFAWSALFCSLGYNFLAYAFIPAEKGGGISWGWLICGVVFELMGGIPLVIILIASIKYYKQRDYRRQLRSEAAPKQKSSDEMDKNYLPKGVVSFFVFVINVGSIAAGIYLAIIFFRHVAG
jgi:hypothetical protein